MSLIPLTSSASAAPAPQAAGFYVVPNPLPDGNPGDVIRYEPSTVNNAHATRIMYLSKDAKDNPMAVTGTVLVPSPKPITRGWAPKAPATTPT